MNPKPTDGGQSKDKQIVREFLRQKPIAERMEPVMSEMLAGFTNLPDHKKLLPDYCYEIFQVFRKTYFRIMPTLDETIHYKKGQVPEGKSLDDVKQSLEIDWRRMGRVVGLALRCFRFGELELEGTLKAEGLLDLNPEEDKQISEMVVSERWLQQKEAELTSKEPGKSLDEILEKHLNAGIDNLNNTFSVWNKLAYQWSTEAMAELSTGIVEGINGFMAEDCHFVGESNRSNIYWFLLMAWPEVREMQAARPEKTRKDFAKWIEPFAKADIVSIRDIDQLFDVCDDIGLKFKGRGAPKKPI